MYRIELVLGKNNNNICVFGDYELGYKDKGKTKAGKYGKTIIPIYGKHDNKHVNIMQCNVQA